MDFLVLSLIFSGLCLGLACFFYLKWQLAEQRIKLAEQGMTDAKGAREDMLTQTKAALADLGQLLSNKLLEDHKRETKESREIAEKMVEKTTQQLHENVKQLTERVASLKDEHGAHSSKMAQIWQALSSPGGAGALAEIGLENSLKNFGLERGRDFDMQYAIPGEQSLRADAVIYLPQNQAMVIDSKASKFLLELGQANSEAEEQTLRAQMSATMNKHLKDLITKDYRAAIQNELKKKGPINTTFMVMYVPSESILEHIHKADPEFKIKAEKAGIIIASPTSLYGLLLIARWHIQQDLKEQNQEHIVRLSGEILDGLAMAFTHVEKLGRNIKATADSFSEFARSTNRYVFSKTRLMDQLGVKPNKKQLPPRLVPLDVQSSEDVIEAENPSAEILKIN